MVWEMGIRFLRTFRDSPISAASAFSSSSCQMLGMSLPLELAELGVLDSKFTSGAALCARQGCCGFKGRANF